jgi:hypothetical protein
MRRLALLVILLAGCNGIRVTPEIRTFADHPTNKDYYIGFEVRIPIER